MGITATPYSYNDVIYHLRATQLTYCAQHRRSQAAAGFYELKQPGTGLKKTAQKEQDEEQGEEQDVKKRR